MSGLKILFANLYDLLLLVAIWIAASVPFVLWQGGNFNDKPFLVLAYQIYLIAITYVYLTYFWVNNGQTPGLRTWKLQLISADGRIISRNQANLRFLFAVIFCLIGWIGLLMPRQQLLQDRLAKTQIIDLKKSAE